MMFFFAVNLKNAIQTTLAMSTKPARLGAFLKTKRLKLLKIYLDTSNIRENTQTVMYARGDQK